MNDNEKLTENPEVTLNDKKTEEKAEAAATPAATPDTKAEEKQTDEACEIDSSPALDLAEVADAVTDAEEKKEAD